MKRFLIILCALTILFCSCFGALSVSAEEVDGRTVIDYRDYVTGYNLDNPEYGWAYLYFPDSMCGTDYYDSFDMRYVAGTPEVPLWFQPNAGERAGMTSFWPGAFITDTFLDLTNIPNGSRVAIQFSYQVYGTHVQAAFNGYANSGFRYYDENFNLISVAQGQGSYFFFDYQNYSGSRLMEIPINKPDGAKYAVFFATADFTLDRFQERDDFHISCKFFAPTLKISTTYTSIIIDSIIKAQRPEGSGSIGDLDNAEDALLGNASEGLGKAEQIVSNGSSYVLINGSGFLFLTVVFDKFANLPFFTGLLYVSLGLGIFSFLCNIATSLGRCAEGSTKKKGGKGS